VRPVNDLHALNIEPGLCGDLSNASLWSYEDRRHEPKPRSLDRAFERHVVAGVDNRGWQRVETLRPLDKSLEFLVLARPDRIGNCHYHRSSLSCR